MTKIIVTIDGMHCPKCAAKVENAISDKFAIKSITASHTDKNAIILTDIALDDEAITSTVKAVGFTVTAIDREEVKEKGFFAKIFKK